MKNDMIALAAALSDEALLARLALLAGKEREATAELIVHLAALDARPSLYASKGFGSLFAYCTQALRLSEDAACNRIEAARACRRFPAIFDLLVSGDASLTAVRLLSRHLTPENHRAVLARASSRTRPEVEALVAELSPRPDVPSSVRRLPRPAAQPAVASLRPAAPALAAPTAGPAAPPVAVVAAPRPIVQPTAPARYRVEFTIGEETYQRLRRLQALLRREIPSGDPAVIFDQATILLLDKVERRKLGKATRPRSGKVIRSRTDNRVQAGSPARAVPNEVRRAVWRRDGGQCAFVSPTGQQCTERSFLEFHHVLPYARQGPATVANISLRCWRHNQYEAELVFGARGVSIVSEGVTGGGEGPWATPVRGTLTCTVWDSS